VNGDISQNSFRFIVEGENQDVTTTLTFYLIQYFWLQTYKKHELWPKKVLLIDDFQGLQEHLSINIRTEVNPNDNEYCSKKNVTG
jgi:hypothetical protein